jgi:hypothetical protein
MSEQNNNNKYTAYNQADSHYEETFYIIPRHIRKLPGMTLALLDFYETCFQFWNKGKSCFLKNPTLKKRTGIKSDSTINDAFQYFEKHNVLKREFKNERRYITPIFCDVETEDRISPQREEGIATARGGVSPERDINKEVLNKENNTTSVSSETPEVVTEVLDVYHDVMYDMPKVKHVTKELISAIRRLKKEWPDIKGSSLTPERLARYFEGIRVLCPWMIEPYTTKAGYKRRNSLINLIRIDNVKKFYNGDYCAE